MEDSIVAERFSSVPPVIWMFWEQGLADAPRVVKLCHESWVVMNPRFVVRILSAESSEFTALASEYSQWDQMPVQKRANILRLRLLSEHGGVWVDSTLFCRQGIDEWLPSTESNGIALVRNYPSRKDRLIDNFFIASIAGHPIITMWLEVTERFFHRKLRHGVSVALGGFLTKLGKRFESTSSRANLWESWLNIRLFRVYPYFIHHYLFNNLVKGSAEFESGWKRAGKISLGSWPLTFNTARKFANDPQVVQELERLLLVGGPFYKLTYRQNKPLNQLFHLLEPLLCDWLSKQAPTRH